MQIEGEWIELLFPSTHLVEDRLVSVVISEISAIKTGHPLAWSPFILGAEFECSSVHGVDVLLGAGGKGQHVAISRMGLFFVIGNADGKHRGLVHALADEGNSSNIHDDAATKGFKE